MTHGVCPPLTAKMNPMRGDGLLRGRYDEHNSFPGVRVRIGQGFEIHEIASGPVQVVTIGFCQPPGGETF
jgi:hypothetical protein